jgi:hypothetical protein
VAYTLPWGGLLLVQFVRIIPHYFQ